MNARIRRSACRTSALVAVLYSFAGVAQAQTKVVPATPAALKLPALIDVAMANQPSLAAARASVAAAEAGKQAVDDIILGRLLSPDLPIRRQQACLGVTIAVAGLQQTEWETRYAVTRNYYSVIYAREQADLILKVHQKLDQARTRAVELVKVGDPAIKVTQIDVDNLTLQIELLKTKEAEASVGVLKAIAALREALGVGPDYPLAVAADILPAPVFNLNRDELIKMGLAHRAELIQASAAQEVTELEVAAQGKVHFRPTVRTFAAAGDIHAKPVPQGVSNGEYRPGAVGPEMPTILVGSRQDRTTRASDFNDRAIATVDKARNLVTLEVEATYLKWLEASRKIESLQESPGMAVNIGKKVTDRFNEGNATGEQYMQARVLEDQVQAQFNEARYLHALALAALERVTAGGYRVGQQK